MEVPKEILVILKREGRSTPIFITKRVHVSKSAVHNTLWAFKKVGIIRTVEHGLYELTPAGLTFMNSPEFQGV